MQTLNNNNLLHIEIRKIFEKKEEKTWSVKFFRSQKRTRNKYLSTLRNIQCANYEFVT